MSDEMYQCEQCGQLMSDPAATETFPGRGGVVTLAFCRDCTEGDR